MLYNNTNLNNVSLLQQENIHHINEIQKVTEDLSHEIALKDQMISALISDNTNLQNQLFKVKSDYESCKELLENSYLSESKINQKLIELQLRILDFKSVVDSKTERIKLSVKNRLGFIPSSIEKDVTYLQHLKVIIL